MAERDRGTFVERCGARNEMHGSGILLARRGQLRANQDVCSLSLHLNLEKGLECTINNAVSWVFKVHISKTWLVARRAIILVMLRVRAELLHIMTHGLTLVPSNCWHLRPFQDAPSSDCSCGVQMHSVTAYATFDMAAALFSSRIR
jgi:hypothetical protein